MRIVDPLPPYDELFPALNSEQTAGPSGPVPSKMKSSGMDDVDLEVCAPAVKSSPPLLYIALIDPSPHSSPASFQALKSYRRLNGYTLFTIVMKKKYSDSNDEGQDQKSQNRRWQVC